ncbi:DUF4091 domain-containing protein [Paenibacillus sp. LHD-117]|uniref:DUF4091 domain-containing protein n=1 Tax=Paenibacillus sp. LHD-117 TaxID=3071412 RepID=UPI0027DEF021|nr:DUF4091 domain-containing protein [Paenibacillus sp. LHD-117]MDQ6419690.1 DUF4091 domain-containing protein [Paenibacillus sp. LHD-117]
MKHPLEKFETRSVSSLAKVFPDVPLTEATYAKGSMLANETYSYQVAYRSDRLRKGIRVKVESAIAEWIAVRSVGLVPSELPAYHDHDEHVLRATPGLYPDPLYPLTEIDGVTALPGQWRSLWISVEPGANAKPGQHVISLAFESVEGERLGEETFELEIIAAHLPKQRLMHTEWFYVDCLATYYEVEIYGEKHWELIDRYLQTAVRHGINMILTPILTPPLDTQVGGERPTVQLLDIEVTAPHTYLYGFDRLKRWVDLCRSRGIEYFEFSHLFTQWGAKHAPKVMATEQSEYKRIFGWETDASGEAYGRFLSQLLPALTRWIQENDLEQCSFFHISDEPTIDHLESYGNANRIVRQYLDGFPIIDALSDYDFYEKGLVRNPVPANNHMVPFVENGVSPLWTYYCCVQYKEVSNRFFNMPSARNRILGIQLYKYNVSGFLHWGYNFWYSQYSRQAVDPYRVTDADRAFASGDSYLVYPGEDGPIESIRLEVLHDALQDLRALQLLEDIYGRAYVLNALEEGLDEPITFTRYPREASWLLSKREWINRNLKEHTHLG